MQVENLNSWTRPAAQVLSQVNATVKEMIDLFERKGDQAIIDKSMQYDGFQPELIELLPFQDYDIEPTLKKHLLIACERIQNFAQKQKDSLKSLDFSDQYGRYGHRLVPLQSAACYIPAGRFPLISSALMTLIPTKVAGVTNRVAVSPSKHPALLAAASLAGATSFLRLGGAQAILAMANGFQEIQKADIICGPGNAYVNAAKEQVQGQVKIDSLAGPSELLILAHPSTPPEFLVEDMLAQAEHDPMALSICVSTDQTLLDSIGQQLDVTEKSSVGDCHLLLADNMTSMIEFSNKMAPEHLFVTYPESEFDPNQLTNYGSLFLGDFSAVALGDYCSGPNHTLPTMGYSSQSGGLYVGDFLKTLTWQKLHANDQYTELASTGIALADAEGLIHHKKSLEVRIAKM